MTFEELTTGIWTTIRFIIGVVILGAIVVGIVNANKKSPAAQLASTTPGFTVTSPQLNCRAEPNARASLVARFDQGATVYIGEHNGGWAKTKSTAGDCWINERFIVPAVDAASTAPAEATAPQTAVTETSPTGLASGPTRVPLVNVHGTYSVPVTINGYLPLDFTLDSGASDVSIPQDVFTVLLRAGKITQDDVIGSQTYTDAEGQSHEAATFTIRSLKVGDIEVQNVRGSVAPPEAPLLLGQSFLRSFKSWSIDNSTHELVLQ